MPLVSVLYKFVTCLCLNVHAGFPLSLVLRENDVYFLELFDLTLVVILSDTRLYFK